MCHVQYSIVEFFTRCLGSLNVPGIYIRSIVLYYHTYMQVEDKSKKVASDNQTLKSRVAELEEQLDWKEKQIGEKNSKIQQV